MLRILNKSWKQNSTEEQLYGYFLPITQTIGLDEQNRLDTTREARKNL